MLCQVERGMARVYIIDVQSQPCTLEHLLRESISTHAQLQHTRSTCKHNRDVLLVPRTSDSEMIQKPFYVSSHAAILAVE